jgi:hypothetical protein
MDHEGETPLAHLWAIKRRETAGNFYLNNELRENEDARTTGGDSAIWG